MDARIRQHADIITTHSTAIEPGETVVVSVPPVAEDLAVALYERIGDVGASPVMVHGGETLLGTDRAVRGYLTAVDEDDVVPPTHLEALFEAADVIIRSRGHANVTERADVPPGKNSQLSRATEAARAEMLDARWCLTQYPSPANAQLAGMSTEAYENFVWDAINKDWEAQGEHQAQLVERLEEASTVHIESEGGTDLTLSIEGNVPINDAGENNLPGGEVFTAPVVDSVEGQVVFDLPVVHQGRTIEGASLEFEDGDVVEYAADENQEVLAEILETDAGASRLGELGIGMNRDIDQFTHNMLFDEKMGDTVHMALGKAYEECVGPGNEVNASAVHVDMIVDMSEDSVIEVDGEPIQRDGTFVFEPEFEA
ncbi:MAG: aminopeptidase [Halodesulfurarchaeum sp.]